MLESLSGGRRREIQEDGIVMEVKKKYFGIFWSTTSPGSSKAYELQTWYPNGKRWSSSPSCAVTLNVKVNVVTSCRQSDASTYARKSIKISRTNTKIDRKDVRFTGDIADQFQSQNVKDEGHQMDKCCDRTSAVPFEREGLRTSHLIGLYWWSTKARTDARDDLQVESPAGCSSRHLQGAKAYCGGRTEGRTATENKWGRHELSVDWHRWMVFKGHAYASRLNNNQDIARLNSSHPQQTIDSTRNSTIADKPARRVYRSVKDTKNSTIPYVKYSFLLCNCNFVFKTFFNDIPLQKCRDLEVWVRGHSRSLKVAQFYRLCTVSH